jgi:hypothetical protein
VAAAGGGGGGGAGGREGSGGKCEGGESRRGAREEEARQGARMPGSCKFESPSTARHMLCHLPLQAGVQKKREEAARSKAQEAILRKARGTAEREATKKTRQKQTEL